MRTNYLIARRLPLMFCFAADVATAQPFQEKEIVGAITGTSTMLEKKQIGKMLSLFAELSQSPERITIANIVSATGVRFNNPLCFKANTGIKICSYHPQNLDVKTFAVSYVRTLTKTSESDSGADVSLQMRRDFACIPVSAMERFWGVKATEGQLTVPDSFADSRPAHLISSEIYRNINPTSPFVYVQTKSVEGCVVDVLLSASKPPGQ